MSISSNDEEYLDGEDNLIGEEEKIDYYALLNISKNATIEEINRAYKQRCLIFHPDRHVDENDKKEAAKIFVLLRKAYETLTDPQLRSIYDTVGIQGLEMHGWQLVEKSKNPENIRKEYEFLKKLRENEIMYQRIHPASNFVLKITLAGLFQENPDDRYAPQVTGLSLAQSVDCVMTSRDKIGLVGRVRSANGRGEGSLVASWRKNMSATFYLENSLTLSQDSLGVSIKLSKNLGKRVIVILQPTLTYVPLLEQLTPSIMLLYTMQLKPDWQGTIALNYSPIVSSLTTSILKNEFNHPKYLANLTLSPINSNLKLAYNKRYSENDFHFESACTFSFMGATPSLFIERKLSRYSKIGAAISFSFPSCLLQAKFKLKTSTNNYETHLVLCDNKEDIARSSIYGVLLPLLFTTVLKTVFRKPLNKLMQLFEDKSSDDHVNETLKEEAERVVHLMRNTAEKIAKEEENKQGLVIIKAQYGQLLNDQPGAKQYPVAGERVIDVTIAVQALVNDSQLRIYSTKDKLPGFYDPCPNEPKMLNIIYKFRNQLHAVTVNDDQMLNIPLKEDSPPEYETLEKNYNKSLDHLPLYDSVSSTKATPLANPLQAPFSFLTNTNQSNSSTLINSTNNLSPVVTCHQCQNFWFTNQCKIIQIIIVFLATTLVLMTFLVVPYHLRFF